MMVTILVLCIFIIFIKSEQSNMGRYIFKLDTIEPCKSPAEPRTVPLPYYVEKYMVGSEEYVRWNLTLPRREGPLQLYLSVSNLRNNSYVLAFESHASPCKHPILRVIMESANITLANRTRCVTEKGFYSSEGLSANYLAHQMTRVLPYGIFRSIFTVSSPAGLITCTEMSAHTVPLKPN